MPTKNTIAFDNIQKPELIPPVIIPISASNRPKALPAGPPICSIDSTKDGIPFFINFGTKQGLALSSVSDGIADYSNNLWFVHYGGGVSKYDGKNFINYTMTQGLASNAVTCLTQDKSGNIWFGTNGGVSRYDGRRFTNFSTSQGLVSNFVRTITEDNSGNIWFGTNNGICRYDGKSFRAYTENQGLASNNVTTSMKDRFGNIWFGTEQGVSKFDGKIFHNSTTKEGLASNNVSSIEEDRFGNLWFGTDNGVSLYDGIRFKNYKTAQGLVNNNVSSIVIDKSGNVWFGTHEGGISRFDGFKFSNYTTDQGLAGNGIACIVIDNSGSVWFGTHGSGLSRYDGEAFKNYAIAEGLFDRNVWSLFQDGSENLWFGTIGAGVVRYDHKSFARFTTAQGLAGNSVRSIFQDNSGAIWFGTEAGVSKYDGKTFINYTTASGLAGMEVCTIIQDKSGYMWFGTDGGGVSRYDGSSFTNYTKAQGLANNNVWKIIQDKSGNIWFGTIGGGVSKFDGKSFVNYNISNGLVGNSVFSILQDASGDIWFGTDGRGACKFDGNHFTKYTVSEGLADNEVYAIVEDSVRKMLWFGTNLGLSGLHLTTLSDGNHPESRFEIFNENSGYPVKDLNVNAMIIDKQGMLWGGCGDNKVIRFDYGANKKRSIPYSLSIINIKVNNENICWNNIMPYVNGNNSLDSLALLNEMVTKFGKVFSAETLDSMRKTYHGIKFDSITRFNPIPIKLVLPYAFNSLTIDFAAIDPVMAKQLKYQYKLEGYDKQWSPVSNGTTAVFGNMPEGFYTFKVKVFNSFGDFNTAEYKFQVLPPWQRTWWAYVCYGIGIFAVIYLADRSRRKRIISKEQVKAKEKELEHAREIEKAYHKLKATQAQLIQSEKMASLGELTNGIAHEIQNPLNFINNFSEVSADLIDELNEELIKGNMDEVENISDDIKQNLEKIIHHGKKADAIVKGMLQHSRSNTGLKEPTDINLLAEEYLKLSYHGFRAKDKAFNAIIHTDFDRSIHKINVVPQAIGRVLVNLFNNAFYTLMEKKKQRGDAYEPTVSVSTKQRFDKVELTVKDNGLGIQNKILDKIYQPFFTTKPTGQGTGLGLSISYDIITKEHGGTIEVRTIEGEGAEFIIQFIE